MSPPSSARARSFFSTTFKTIRFQIGGLDWDLLSYKLVALLLTYALMLQLVPRVAIARPLNSGRERLKSEKSTDQFKSSLITTGAEGMWSGLITPPAPSEDVLPSSITDAVISRHKPTLNSGKIEGSLRVLLGESFTINGNSQLTSDLFLPGAPTITLNGGSHYGGTVVDGGAATPANYTITLNGGVSLAGSIHTHVDAVALPADFPNSVPTSTGTRTVSVTSQSGVANIGNWQTVRDLNVTGSHITINVPPGNYRTFTVNGNSQLNFTAGTYNFSNTFTLDGSATLQTTGLVTINVGQNLTINSGAMVLGSYTSPGDVRLNVLGSAVNINGSSQVTGLLRAYNGTTTINGTAQVRGQVIADAVVFNGSGKVIGAVWPAQSSCPSIFGPRRFDRTTGPPNQYLEQFSLPAGFPSPFTLHIQNGEADGTHRVSSATVKLNGVDILSPSDLNQNVAGLDRTVTLATNNQLDVRVASVPGSYLIINICGTASVSDTTAPAIAITSPADNSTTTATAITVNGTATDTGAGATGVAHVYVNNVEAAYNSADGTWSISNVALALGSNQILARAVDQAGNQSTTSITVTRQSPTNHAPTANAGPDQTLTLPQTASLHGAASDDGLPAGSTLTTTWIKVTGPGTVTFQNAAALDTTASFSADGSYVLRLDASDGALSASDDITITVQPQNQPPTVTAGPDQTIALPHTATLNGTVTDDGLPAGSAVTSTWSQVSGPGTVIFEDATLTDTSATFSAPGTYVLRLTASDGELTAKSDVTITVQPENHAPTVSAGQDQIVSLPNAAQLSGSASDDGLPVGSSLAVSWSMVSGPGSVVFDNPNSTATLAHFGVAGVYALRLTATDGELSSTADVTINVTPPNQAPTVNAGADQAVNLPNVANLNGTVGDDGLPLGSGVSTLWSTVSGPGTVTFANPNVTVTTASFSVAGIYVLRLSASDSQLNASDDITITVVAQNQPPTADAGPDQTITLPNTAQLNGATTDDGLPAGSSLSSLWSKVSGPGTVTFSNPNAATTNASFSVDGTYILRLTASDSGLSSRDDVVVIVIPENHAPTVAAGPDQTITLPNSANLNGSVSDDGLPQGSSVSTAWSMVSGPGFVTFANPNVTVTSASFSVAGTYVLRLTATDSQLSSSDDIQVIVIAENHAPSVDAGASKTITLPNSASLNGDVIDDGLPAGSTLTSVWTKSTGPGTVSFANANSPVTTASFSVSGTYELRLTASDSELSTYSNVVITVIAENHAPTANAGTDETITLPNTANLNGSASDDGLPAGTSLTTTWTKVSGSGTVTFGNPGVTVTTAAFSEAGTYVLRLTASDSQLSASDDVQITVIPENHAPTANAGPDQQITLPNVANLNGSVSDDGLPSESTLSSTWSKVSGPGTVTFANPNVTVTAAAFSEAGTYVLRLTASDSELTAADDITVIVIDSLAPPVANFVVPESTGTAGAFVIAPVGSNAEALLDNDIATSWSTPGIDNQFVTLQFFDQQMVFIDRVRLQARNGVASDATLKDFDVQVSSTNSSDAGFATVFSGTLLNNGQLQEFVFPSGPARARFIKLLLKNRYSSPGSIQLATFNPVAVGSADNIISLPGQTNAALSQSPGLIANGAAIYESTYPGGSSSANGLLGYYNGGWVAPGLTNQFATIQLAGGKVYTLDGVKLATDFVSGYGSATAVKDFEVWVSTTTPDAASFTRVLSASSAFVGRVQTFMFPGGPVQARYVKYVPLNNFGGGPTINTLVFDVIAEGGSHVVGLSGEYADGPNPAEAAFDGDRNSYWYGPNAVLTNVWVKTALADNAIHRIYGVRINPLDGFATGLRGPKDFDIRVSTTTTDDSAFTTVYSGTLIEDYNTGPQQFLFNNLVDARYVEFYWKNSYSSSAISVSELEVLAAPDRGSSVVGFSSGAGGVEAALDLDPTNQPWITPNNQNTNVWFKLLLPRAELSTISHIALRPAIAYNGNYSAPKDFQLQVSTTDSADSSFTTVFAGTLADSSQMQDFYFAPVQARYVRLSLLKGPNDTGSFALHNFLIYSSDTIGSTTQFIERSSDADGQVVSWAWNFGDGTTSTLKNPTHTFAQPGDYTVSLTVTDNSGLTGTYSSLYHVVQSLTADFSFSPMIAHEGGEAVRFTDLAGLLSVPTALRQYDFGDGSDLYSQYARTSVHTFQDSGVFHVTLKVGDALGVSHTITKDITVLNLPPVVDIDPGKTVVWGEQWTSVPRISDQSSVDSASLHGLWDFGDGQTTPCVNCTNANATVTHAYSNPGTYTATLTITDNDGSSASDSAVFTVNKHPITLAFQDAPPPELGQPVLLRVRLMDSFTNQPLVGRTIQFQLNGATAAGTTDANGYAEAQVAFGAGMGTNTATATVAEDGFYLGGSTYRVLPGAANQQSCTRGSTGTDFWLMFPGNYISQGVSLAEGTFLDISAEVATTGMVTVPGQNFSATFSVAAHSTTRVQVNTEHTHSNQIENQGIHVVAQSPVTVYGLNNIFSTVDAYLGLPTNALGNNYVVLGYGNGGSVKGTQFGLVASAADTSVTITPSVTVGQRLAGVPYNITLNQGQTYLLRDDAGTATDLSGTFIQADKPVAVFGGHQCANIPVNYPYCDHIVEQLPPSETWGTHFATLPLATRTKGDTFRFLAATNDTHVFLNSSRIATLNRGQYFEKIIDGPAEIASDQPILVAQYANSHQYDNLVGDPFMMLIPPLEHYLSSYTVNSLAFFDSNLINVIAPTSDIGAILLDGNAIAASSFVPIAATGMSGAQLTVSTGAHVHTLSGPHPFGVYVYGFGLDVSYGYPGSACLASVLGPTNLTLAPKAQNATIGAQSCVTATVKDQGNTPVNNQNVTFTITGAHPQTPPAQRTNELGQIQLCYASATAGDDLITAATTGSNASSSDTASISWGSLNQPPTVNAGSDQTLTTSCVANLSGTAVDDGVPAGSSLTVSWSKVSGPGIVTFSNPASLVTTASFSAVGSYVLRLTASDSALSSSDDVAVVVGSNAQPQPAHYFEPTPYLSYQDSPFRTLSLSNFHLEDFEDHLFNTPGVSANNGGVVSVNFGPGYHDSVDADDGVIDGHGDSGDNFFNGNGASGTRFTFDANVLGGLPTHAGLVWTDGAGVVYFEAFDRNGASMGLRGPYNLPDAVYDGGTAEDRFLGAYNPGGISAIYISNTIGGLEIDHLQFGFGDGNGAPNVNAGADQRILLPATTAALNGSVTDDGLPACGTLTISWSKVNGPGAVTFANPNAAATTATFSALGTYVLRLTANDSALTSSDDVTIVVTANQPPVADFALASNNGPVQLSTVSYSSYHNDGYETYHPKQLLDTNSNTYWQTASGQVSNQFAVFRPSDGQAALIDRVRLQNAFGPDGTNVHDFDVQVSTATANASDFHSVLIGSLPNNPTPVEFVFPGGPATARFVKLVIVSNYGSSTFANLSTFQPVSAGGLDSIVSFLGAPNSALNQSPALVPNGGAIYDFSYSGGSNTPDQMLGYYRGGWVTTSTANQFATIQLGGGRVYTLDGVKLATWYDSGYGYATGVKDFEVWVSATTPDASSFTRVLSATVVFNPQLQTFTFPGGPVQARYVKYVPLNNGGGGPVINTQMFDVIAEGVAKVVGASGQLEYATTPPEQAFDGNANSFWYGPNGAGSDVWVKTSLEDETIHKVSGVRITPLNSYYYGYHGPKDFDIRVSTTTTDESAFTTVYSGTLDGAVSNNAQEFVFSNPVNAKYVEFYWKNSYSGSTIAVSELEVLADSAHGSTIVGYSSSSDPSSQGPANVLDIDTISPWVTANGQNTNQWMKLSLPNSDLWTIDHIALMPGFAHCGFTCIEFSVSPKDFELQVSTTDASDASFSTVLSGSLVNTATLQHFSFPAVQARYVRLLLKNNYGSGSIALLGFYVYTPDHGSSDARFVDRSTDADGQVVSWAWNFGDGGTSTEQSPLHHYAAAGSYAVTLTVTDDGGLTSNHQMTYTASGSARTPDFTFSPVTAYEGAEYVRFTDTTQLLVQPYALRVFDFGNGFSVTDLYQANYYPYQFPDSGTFNIRMTLGADNGLKASVTKPITVLNLPPSVTVDAGKTVVWGEQWTNAPHLSDPSPIDSQTLRGVWDFGDGQNSVCLNCNNANGTIMHSYAVPGVYTATLAVTDKDGGAGSASATYTVNKRPTAFVFQSPPSRANGAPLVIHSTLMDTFANVPLSGKPVQFTLNGASFNAVTGSDGVAEVSVPMPAGTKIDIIIGSFSGDAFYASCSGVGVPVTAGGNSPGGTPTNMGTDFWLMFPQNYSDGYGTALQRLFITSPGDTSGTVTIPGLNFTQNFTVQANTLVTVPLGFVQVYEPDVIQNKGIHVTSAQPVAVYGLNQRTFTSDAFLGLPVNALGKDYYILTYSNMGFAPASQFGVVATENGTTVTITPAVTTGSRQGGVAYNIALNQGQTYLLQNNIPTTAGDLSGSRVTSDKPVGVFGSHEAATIPAEAGCCADHLLEQLPPTSAWGKRFATIPIATRTKGDFFRLIAAQDNTAIYLNSNLIATLNRGQWIERILKDPAEIISTQPIMVAQFATSIYYDYPTTGKADPFMMIIPPYSQFLNHYTITTPTTGFEINYANVVAPTALIGSITLDGAPIPASGFVPIGVSGYSGSQVPLTVGTHSLDGPASFGVFVYGFAQDEGYGYPGGMNMAASVQSVNVVVTPETSGHSINHQACVVATVTDQDQNPLGGKTISFTTTGAHPAGSSATTDAAGQAALCYTATSPGTDQVAAAVGAAQGTATVIWTPSNSAPTANAGVDQTITLPAPANLQGSATDDGLPASTLNISWSKLSGPGNVTFASGSSAMTMANFDAPGVYVLRLTASDTELSTSDDVQVTVNPNLNNQPPTANAGADQTTAINGNLIVNSGNEQQLINNQITGWIQVQGSWTQGTVNTAGFPPAQRGSAYFSAGNSSPAELRQDIDVSAFSSTINAGAQQFALQAYVRSALESVPDVARVVFEYRDATNTNVIATLDSGSASIDSALSDEFNTSAIDSKWTRIGSEAAMTEGAGALHTSMPSQSGDRVNMLVQPIPAGDWEMVTKLDNQAAYRNYNSSGLLLAGDVVNNPSSAGLMTYQDAHFASNAHYLYASKWANRFTFGGDLTAFATLPVTANPLWQKIIKSGTNYTFWYSTDGITYSQMGGAVAESSFGFTPVYVGIYTNNAITGVPVDAYFDFFHVSVSASTDAWHLFEDTRPAPVGTGWIRVRLLATRNSGASNDAFFDSISLRPVGNAGVKLNGTATDDGLPYDSSVSANWTAVSGPGSVTFTNASAASSAASFTTPGIYTLRLIASDGQLSASDDVTVTVNPANQPPVVSAGANQTITLPGSATLNGTATDDGQPSGSSLSVSWAKVSGPGTVSFANANSAATTASFSTPGSYLLRLNADDSEYGASADVTITVNPATVNQPPTVNAGADQTISLPANTITLNGSAADDGYPAGSTLSVLWTTVSGPAAVTFGSPNTAVTTAQFSTAGTYVLRLTASDGALTASDDVTVIVTAANQAPTVNAGADQTTILSAGAQLNGTVSDDGLPAGSHVTTTWSRISGPGTVTFMNANVTVTGAQFSATGTYVLRLTASDGALSTSDDVTITVNDDVPPPTVQITAPADDASVTEPTIVTGSVSGGAWTLEYSLDSTDDPNSRVWTQFASGNGPISNGSLGTVDPTMMLNGLFDIRLSATDTYGQTSRTKVSVIVERNLKVGNFTVSFTDLSIPVAGVPMEVTRTYDSRDKRVGDFGFGWTLGLHNIRVEKSSVIGLKWYETVSQEVFPNYCLEPVGSHAVTVTFPGGKVFKFQPNVAPHCQRNAPITSANISFTAMPGTVGKLEVIGSSDVQIDGSVPGPVNLIGFASGVDIFNSFVFKFTAEDGTAYIIDQRSGLQSLSDPNGNTLTIGAGGIVHSSGKSIVFNRDVIGRIESIVDPNGNSQFYHYDPNGDLVSYTDNENNTSTYTYDANHRLLTIHDPRNIQPIRNDYDSSGRLISHTDGFNKVVTYLHDIPNRTETVTDRLNHSTVFEYDERGNVLRKTDARGGVTRFTYDANDNVLTETNALDKTTIYTYDENDHRTSITDPLNHITQFTYNVLGKVLTRTDPRHNVTTNTYSSAGKLLTTEDALHNVTTYVYSPFNGQMISMTDALHQTTSYTYTGGYLTKQTDALGNETTFTYDNNGNPASQTVKRTNAQGQLETITTGYEYDKLNRLMKTTFADGSFTKVEYNSIGKQGATVDQLNHRTEFTYDDMGRLTKTTYADSTSEETTYDAEGRRLKSKDRAGHETSYTYDELGRLTRTTFVDGAFTQTSYDAAGRVLTTTDARNNVTRYFYDDAGRRTKVKNALNQETTFSYDDNGNQLSMTDALNHPTSYDYDPTNRRTKTTYADGTFDSVVYDAVDRTTSKTDQANKTTQFTYDSLGRLTKVKDALNQDTTYGYNEVGQQTSQTDANNHTTRFEYDQVGRRVKRILPGGQVETYAYDNDGNLSSKTDFNGKTTTFGYDTMRRLLSKTPDPSLGQPTVSFTYTANGQRATMSDASGATVYSYDARNRLSSKQTSFGTLSYTYNEAGSLLTTRSSNANGASVDYSYDVLNRLATAKDNQLAGLNGGVTTYTYDTVGNLQSYQYPNGVNSNYAYNSLNRLTTMTVGTQASSLAGYSYTLGPAGNRTAVTDLGGRTVNYTYDDLYRLTSESIANDPHGVNGTAGYGYDPVGNRLNRSSSIAAVPSQNSTYDANDRLTSDTYDNNGNTIGSTGNSYAYDFENHLTSLNSGTVQYLYDGDGNRVAKTVGGVTTNYLVDTNNSTGYAQVVEELQGGLVIRAFTYGNERISQRIVGGSLSFYQYDGHGSVRLLTNAAGATTDGYDYDAFGNLIYRSGTTLNDYLSSGEQFDANLGFYYHRARYMNPSSGRFWTMDSFEGRRFDPVSLHKYLYCGNDPINRRDPYGRDFSLASLQATLASALTLVSITAFQALQFLNSVGDKLAQAFEEGGNPGAVFNELGAEAEFFAQEVFEVVPEIEVEAQEVAVEGGKFIDFVVRSGDRLAAVEVKYSFGLRSPEALQRAVAQVQGALSTGTYQRVMLWSLQTPTDAQLLRLNAALEAAGAGGQYQLAYGINGLAMWAAMFSAGAL